MSTTRPHVLDNPIWNALLTGNSAFAAGNHLSRHIRRDMGAFAGMPHYGPETWNALYEVTPAGEMVVLFTANPVAVPGGWQLSLEKALLQMVHSGTLPEAAPDSRIVPLGESHIPAMLTLTQLTRPGPFLQRTIDFGNYEGIFEGGELVSMAGQRLQPDPYTEVSAVCTHSGALGKGYAGLLLQCQIRKIGAAGRTPFLHVYPENGGAIRLYRKLGFEVRRELMVYVLKKKDA